MMKSSANAWFALALGLILPGCKSNPSDSNPPDGAWGWDANIVQLDPGRALQVRDGSPYGSDGFILCGQLDDSTAGGFVLRTTMAGGQVWFEEMANPAVDVDVTASGVIRVAGATPDDAAWFASFDGDGAMSGLTILDNLEPRVVRGTPDGGCVFAAHAGVAIELLKFSESGVQQWRRTISGGRPYDASDVAVLDDGCLITGQGEVDDLPSNWLLIRVAADGSVLWITGAPDGAVLELEAMPDGSFAAIGVVGLPERRGSLRWFDPLGFQTMISDLGPGFIPRFLAGIPEDGSVLAAGQNELQTAIRPVVLRAAADASLTRWEFTLQHGSGEGGYRDVFITCAGMDTSGQVVAVGTADFDGDSAAEIWFHTLE